MPYASAHPNQHAAARIAAAIALVLFLACAAPIHAQRFTCCDRAHAFHIHAGPLEVLPENDEPEETKPPTIQPSPAVTRLLEGPVLSDAAKQRARVFHGRWDDLDPQNLPPALLAQLRSMQGQTTPELASQHPAAAYHNATIALRLGQWDQAQQFANQLPDNHAGIPADDTTPAIPHHAITLLHAQLADARSEFNRAADLLRPLRERYLFETPDTPAALVAAAQSIALLARLEGRPASDYRRAVALLETAIDRDPLHHPAKIALAQLLAAKDNAAQAGELALEALQLNPHAADAWETLGHLNVDRWDFVAAQQIIDELHQRTPGHPAIDTLTVRRALYAADLTTANAAIRAARDARPDAPELLAWDAAVAARNLDLPAARQLLQQHADATHAHPVGPFIVGDILATARRYDDARPFLQAAVDRQPNDAAPRLALGLMLMQLGDLPAARQHLADTARLDPFHAGVENSLQLVSDMLTWPTLQSDNFLVRHAPGPDAALAADLPPVMEQHRVELAQAFGQATDNLTQIDLLPDSQTFAVRVTGQSELGALAACTGDVLAVAPPRIGAAQIGIYHWADVMRHEYVHAIIFDLSDHLAPRWFHEGTATHFEQLERNYDTQQMLAHALHHDQLIPFEKLAAAFGSPQIMLAYQQSGWIIEFITQTHGNQALNQMMTAYANAGSDADALFAATGQTPEQFFTDFKAWAQPQAQAWGLAAPPPSAAKALLEKLLDANDQADQNPPQPPTQLDPVAVERLESAKQALKANDPDADQALRDYIDVRPNDPWPRRQLAARALQNQDHATAIQTLRWLDQRELHDPQWAIALASLLRERNQHARAYDAIESAIFRDPYNATLREQAATLALLQRDFDTAETQIAALRALEPDVPLHQQRLNALRAKRNAPNN